MSLELGWFFGECSSFFEHRDWLLEQMFFWSFFGRGIFDEK